MQDHFTSRVSKNCTCHCLCPLPLTLYHGWRRQWRSTETSGAKLHVGDCRAVGTYLSEEILGWLSSCYSTCLLPAALLVPGPRRQLWEQQPRLAPQPPALRTSAPGPAHLDLLVLSTSAPQPCTPRPPGPRPPGPAHLGALVLSTLAPRPCTPRPLALHTSPPGVAHRGSLVLHILVP